MALVSSRHGRLLFLANNGDRRAKLVVELRKEPIRFLSTIQIGITIAGLLAGAFSGARLSGVFALFLSTNFPILREVAHEGAFVVVILLMTLFTLVFGELIPKRIAISNPETIAISLADFINHLIRFAVPFNRLLSFVSNGLLRLFGISDTPNINVTTDEVKHFLIEGVEAGVLEAKERELLDGVMRLADRSIKTIMTPRTDLFWVDYKDPPEVLQKRVVQCPYALMVIADGSIDEPMGVVFKKDLLSQVLDGSCNALDIKAALCQPILVSEDANTLGVIEMFRNYPVHCAFVLDEYGSLQGLVTLTDIIHGITGHLADDNIVNANPIKLEDGSWIMHGDMCIIDLERYLSIPRVELASYHTLGGHLLSLFGRIPKIGDRAEIGNWVLEVIAMEGRRVSKVLIVAKLK